MRRFFSSRWQGQVPSVALLWRDMVAIGTLVNVLASFAALMMVARGGATSLAMLLHFAPIPYNLFLFLCLWRTPQRSVVQAVIGAAWLAVMTVV